MKCEITQLQIEAKETATQAIDEIYSELTDNDLDDFYASDDDQTVVPASAKTKKMKKKKVSVRDFIDDEAEECSDSEEESVKKVKKGAHTLHKQAQPALISTSSEDNSEASDNEVVPPRSRERCKVYTCTHAE